MGFGVANKQRLFNFAPFRRCCCWNIPKASHDRIPYNCMSSSHRGGHSRVNAPMLFPEHRFSRAHRLYISVAFSVYIYIYTNANVKSLDRISMLFIYCSHKPHLLFGAEHSGWIEAQAIEALTSGLTRIWLDRTIKYNTYNIQTHNIWWTCVCVGIVSCALNALPSIQAIKGSVSHWRAFYHLHGEHLELFDVVLVWLLRIAANKLINT